LRQACCGPGLDQRACEAKLLFETVVRGPIVVIPAPASMQVFERALALLEALCRQRVRQLSGHVEQS
jgi:hypothetical protein